jgi:hypothetical protein
MFQKGMEKRGGRKKGTPNRISSEIRQQMAKQVLRYFAPPERLPYLKGEEVNELNSYEDTMNFEADMTLVCRVSLLRLKLMLQMAKLVLPPPKDSTPDTIFLNASTTDAVSELIRGD